MSKTIHVTLNTKSINHAIKELQDYKASLKDKLVEFVDELAQVGIKVGNATVADKYSGSVTFEREIEGQYPTVVGVVMGYDTQKMKSWWYYKGGRMEVEISPILMSEFGSGNFAASGWQGSLSVQGHAFDPYWSWTDDDGHHTSSGEHPTQPVHTAAIQMMEQVEAVARKVFA